MAKTGEANGRYASDYASHADVAAAFRQHLYRRKADHPNSRIRLIESVWDPFTTWLWRVPHHLDLPPEVFLNPALAAAGVALVDPQVLDAGEVLGNSLQQEGHASTVLNVSRVHFCPQHKAQAVHQDVALAAVDAFGHRSRGRRRRRSF